MLICAFLFTKRETDSYGQTDTGVPSSWVVLPSSWSNVWEFGSLPQWRNQVISWVLTAPVNSSFMQGRKGWKGE